MSLLRRILPIADELRSAQGSIEDTLRDLTYTQDRDAVVRQLRESAAHADRSATKARELAKAVEAGFGTLPEPLPEGLSHPQALGTTTRVKTEVFTEVATEVVPQGVGGVAEEDDDGA